MHCDWALKMYKDRRPRICSHLEWAWWLPHQYSGYVYIWTHLIIENKKCNVIRDSSFYSHILNKILKHVYIYLYLHHL